MRAKPFVPADRAIFPPAFSSDYSRRRRRCRRRRFLIALVRSLSNYRKDDRRRRERLSSTRREEGDVRCTPGRGRGKRTNKRAMPLSFSLYLSRARDNILSGRFAVRLTIAGNYLPLPRARRDPSRPDPTRALLAGGFYGGHRLVPRRILSLSLFLLSTPRAPPRPSARARSKTSASSPIGGDGGGGSSGLVFLLSLALRSNHFARLFTSSM